MDVWNPLFGCCVESNCSDMNECVSASLRRGSNGSYYVHLKCEVPLENEEYKKYSGFHPLVCKVLKMRIWDIPPTWAASVVNYCPSRSSQLFANNRNKTWQTNKVIYVRNSWVCPTLLSLLLRHSDWDWDLGDGEQSDKRIYVFSFSIPFEKDHFRTSISFLWH